MNHKRKCIACGEFKEKNELIKITKEYQSGNIVVQPDSKTFGRSAYVCINEQCIENALKKNKINKFLKTSLNFDKNAVYEELNKK